MPEELLLSRTKLIVPQRRRELLTRPRLLDLLSDLLDYRLIIIAAPAGYGKTSLMIDFASHFDWPVCWYALDPLDGDLQRFLYHFIQTIKLNFPDFGDEAENLLRSSSADQINLDHLVSVLANDIYEKITEHFVVVLDDYHLLNANKEIDKFLSEFIQRTDDNCHVVITSRRLLTLPDLPLMVARSQVGGLSIEELTFLPEEIRDLYNQVFDRDINLQQAKEIADRTEGWITGLLLTSPMLKTGLGEPVKITRASGIGLYEYLAQQVLDQQTDEIREFLIYSSLLEEFDVEMCEEVLGKALGIHKNWNRIFKTIVQNNLFVLPVDDEFRWLRYHHLFRDFLQSKLLEAQPKIAENIKLCLADYFSEKRDWDKVFDIYRSLEKPQFIAHLLEKVGTSYTAKGKTKKLVQWFEEIGEEIIYSNPKLLSIKAICLVNQGLFQDGKNHIDRAIEMNHASGDDEGLADNLIRRSSILRVLGDYASAMEDAEKAIELTANRNNMNMLFAEAMRTKGILLYQMGKLKEGLDHLDSALSVYRDADHHEDAARVLVEIGAVSESLGLFDEAERAYQESLVYWQSVGDSIWVPTILNNLGVLQHSTGEFSSSFINLEKSIHYAQATGNQRMEGYSLASIGDLYKDLDALKEAYDAYIKALEIAQRIEDQFLIFYLKTAMARMDIIRKNFTKAEMQIHTAKTIAKKSGSPYEMNKCRLEQSALDYFKKHYRQVSEELVIAESYFSNEGHIEDSIRAKIFLFSSYLKQRETIKARPLINSFIMDMDDPVKKVSSLAAAHELKTILKPLKSIQDIDLSINKIFKKLEVFEKATQKSRRQIRKHATVVPFAPPKLEIRALGSMDVYIQNKPLTISEWKTRTSRDLFFYFLANPEGLTKEEIGIIFWPESTSAELKLRFKNAIYRMRHAVGKDTVQYRDNYYQFNRSIDYEYDVQNFLTWIEKARISEKKQEKMAFLSKAVNIYRGPYLPEIGEIWPEPDRQRYLDLYIQSVKEFARLKNEQEEFNESLESLQQALNHDPCNEILHRLAMEIYAEMGNQAGITRQFDICTMNLRDHIGVQPSEDTYRIYQELMARS